MRQFITARRYACVLTDDTRISKMVSSQEDCIKLQEDLKRAMKLSTENNMQLLHRDKFELLVDRYKLNTRSLIILHYIHRMTFVILALL